MRWEEAQTKNDRPSPTLERPFSGEFLSDQACINFARMGTSSVRATGGNQRATRLPDPRCIAKRPSATDGWRMKQQYGENKLREMRLPAGPLVPEPPRRSPFGALHGGVGKTLDDLCEAVHDPGEPGKPGGPNSNIFPPPAAPRQPRTPPRRQRALALSRGQIGLKNPPGSAAPLQPSPASMHCETVPCV